MCAFAVSQPIIRTKLYAPRLPAIVPRPRLQEQLNAARSVKLITVVAGAGYGKSTLAAEFLGGLDRPFVWYQLEDTDADLSEFLSYLVAGLRGIYADFGEKTVAQLASSENVANQSRAILSTFIAELDTLIGEDLYIVLDDFHVVNDSKPIIEAMDFILSHMLPNLHFMLLSRTALALDLYSWRAHRELLEVEMGDLCFNTEETSVLFRDIFAMPLSERDMLTLSESTEGWISGLVLFYLALKGKQGEGVSSILSELGGPPSAVSDFLSKAVYENQSDIIKEFLIQTSILSRMNPLFCEELLEMEESRGFLGRLTDERLFTIPLDDSGEWYRYHHCLGAFLLKTLYGTQSPASIKELHMKAAALWEKYGEPEQALHHYMDAGSYESAAKVLESIDVELMRANRIWFLDREMARLPKEVLQQHPRLWLRSGQTAGMLGDWDRVQVVTRAAAEAFEKMGEAEKQARSLLGLAEALLMRNKPGEAGEIIVQVRDIMPESSPFWIEMLGVESVLAVTAGQVHRAAELLEEALSRFEDIKHERLRVTASTWCGLALYLLGRLGRALDILAVAGRPPEKTGITTTHHFLYALLARSFAFFERLEDARDAAEKGVAFGEGIGLTPMIFLDRAARAVAWAYLGQNEKARDDAAVAARLCSEYRDMTEVLFTEWYLGEAYGLLGDVDESLKHLKRFEHMGAAYADFALPEVSIISSSAIRWGHEETEAAIGRLISTRAGHPDLALSLAYSLLLTLKLETGQRAEASGVWEAYSGEFGPDVILRSSLTDPERLLSFFAEIFARGSHADLMERVFAFGGARSTPYLRLLAKVDDPVVSARARELLATVNRQSAAPLFVNLLGRFKVTVSGAEFAPQEWKSKKALSIFKYLASNRNRGYIPRDILMELLWPEASPEAAAKNLNVALSSLRKTLERNAGRGVSSYLVTLGDSLRLEVGGGGWIDTEVFREKLKEASAAKERGDFGFYFKTLHEATGFYRGDFLSEDLYEDWCRQEREQLLNDYVGIVVDLATEHLRIGEQGEALVHLEDALAKNPAREELYRKQMAICSQMGNRVGIETSFQRCSKFLHENYDVEPSAETIEVYQRLRKE